MYLSPVMNIIFASFCINPFEISVENFIVLCLFQPILTILLTLPTAEILSGKNMQVGVSMVLHVSHLEVACYFASNFQTAPTIHIFRIFLLCNFIKNPQTRISRTFLPLNISAIGSVCCLKIGPSWFIGFNCLKKVQKFKFSSFSGCLLLKI